MYHTERNNHPDQNNANDIIHNGGCGDATCRRNVSGMLFLVGTSLDF